MIVALASLSLSHSSSPWAATSCRRRNASLFTPMLKSLRPSRGLSSSSEWKIRRDYDLSLESIHVRLTTRACCLNRRRQESLSTTIRHPRRPLQSAGSRANDERFSCDSASRKARRSLSLAAKASAPSNRRRSLAQLHRVRAVRRSGGVTSQSGCHVAALG